MLSLGNKSRKTAKNSYTDSGPLSRSTTTRNSSSHSGGAKRSWGGLWRFIRWVLGLSLCAAVILGLVVGLLAMYRYATTSDFFALEKVDIRGATHFRREDILKLADLQQGRNSLTINISQVENALSQNPWVAHVAVKRRLPNAFEIHVEERVPAFWLLKDGVLHYVDANGRIIAPVEPGNFLSLPTLEILPGGEGLRVRIGALLDSLHKADLPLDLAAVSTLRLSSAKGLEIVMDNMNLTVCISPDDWEVNLRRLNAVLRDLARRGELKNTREIWLADGSVWVIMAN